MPELVRISKNINEVKKFQLEHLLRELVTTIVCRNELRMSRLSISGVSFTQYIVGSGLAPPILTLENLHIG